MPSPDSIPIVQWVLVLVQVLTLIGLLVYVWKTWEMARATLAAAKASADTVQEMRIARHEAAEPRPFIYFGTDDVHMSEIIIENAGQSTAADLTFHFDPPLQASQHPELARKFFDTPKYLAPGSRLRHALDSWPQYFGAKLPLQYTVTVRFRRQGDTAFREETQILDAAGFQHYMQWGRKGVHDIADEIHKFADTAIRASREQANDRQRDAAAAELLPASWSLQEALAVLRGLWKAHLAIVESKETIDWIAPYLPVLRRATLTGLVRIEQDGCDPGVATALSNLFVVLNRHDWRVMSHGQAVQALEQAFQALDEALGSSDDKVA
jgi:hypothetical protein